MILTELQATPNWEQPGNVGNDGGASPKPHGKYSITLGKEAEFSIQPAGPYDNFYFLKRLGDAFLWTRRYRLEFSLFLASADLSKCQAIESELQKNALGWILSMGLQWRPDGVLSTFDYNDSRWDTAASGVEMRPDYWNDISADFEQTVSPKGDLFLTHCSITINDKEYRIGVTRPATRKDEPNYFNVAYQMDSNSKGESYKSKIQALDVTLF